MQVKSIMTEDPITCLQTTNLKEVARMMADRNCGEIPVVDTNMKPVGVVTDRDITCRAVAAGRNPLNLTAVDCMTSPCVTVTPETDVTECYELLQDSHLRRILVVDETGRLCGIVAQADVAKYAPPLETARLVKEVSEAV